MNKNIAIDFRKMSDKVGISTYLKTILQDIESSNDSNTKFFLLVNKNNTFDFTPYRHKNVIVKEVISKSCSFYENIEIPLFLAKNKISLYHATHFNLPLLSVLVPSCKKVTTIHDIIPYERQEFFDSIIKKIYFKFFFTFAAKYSHKIITRSQTVKDKIIKLFNVDSDKILVDYNCNMKMPEGQDIEKIINNRKQRPRRNILFVGSLYSNKNVISLIRAFKILKQQNSDLKLSIIGRKPPYYKVLKNEVIKLDLASDVEFLGSVADEKIVEEYKRADIFVFPSLEEGLGVPPLEAMSYGLPVVSSNKSVMPEILADACILTDPTAENIAFRVQKLINDKELYDDYVQRGFARAEYFSKLDFNTIKLYNDLLFQPKCLSEVSQKLRVLMVHHLFSFHGGAETSVYNEAQILKDMGHEVFIFATDKKPYIEENYEYAKYFPQYFDHFNFSRKNKFKYIQHIKDFFKLFYNFEAKRKLDEMIKDVKPDIVHFHNILYYLTPSVLKACYENNVPVVMTMRDVRLLCPSANLRLGDRKYCKNELCIGKSPIHCLIHKCKHRSFIVSAVIVAENLFGKMTKLYDKIQAFICPSRALYDLAIRSGMPENKLAVISNFVDDSFLNNKPENSEGEYFLYAGRLTLEKGVDVLIKAMSKLPDVPLVVAGAGTEEESLKRLANKLKLNNIKFTGFQQKENLQELYKNCIATILPCDWFEIFGKTIIESFSFEKPVIGSNRGALPELINDGECGIIFNPENIDELVDAIEKLYKDKNLARQMGEKGRLRVEKMFNKAVHYEELIKVYENVLNGV